MSVAGALTPDAHVGYGLPIGGVLATENAVIPYAVGVDIACRMAYKNIREVMAAQSDLVTTLGQFDPKLVKMAPHGERAED